jgi:hypothetical protein
MIDGEPIYIYTHVRTYIYTIDLIYEIIKFLKFKGKKKQTHLFIIVEIIINKIVSIFIYIFIIIKPEKIIDNLCI